LVLVMERRLRRGETFYVDGRYVIKNASPWGLAFSLLYGKYDNVKQHGFVQLHHHHHHSEVLHISNKHLIYFR